MFRYLTIAAVLSLTLGLAGVSQAAGRANPGKEKEKAKVEAAQAPEAAPSGVMARGFRSGRFGGYGHYGCGYGRYGCGYGRYGCGYGRYGCGYGSYGCGYGRCGYGGCGWGCGYGCGSCCGSCCW